MAACEELESLILDRVAGTLPPSEAAALDGHLDCCPRCRAWRASCEEAIHLAALPAPSEAERRTFAGLPARARAAFRQRALASVWGRPLVASAIGTAMVGALMLMVIPRAGVNGGAGAPRAAAADVGSEEELVTWALSDPLEDPTAADADEAAGVDDDSIETEPELDLEWEQTE